jgi:Tfp pilus assembly protein FimT
MIEILIVVVIIGIVAALAIPMVGNTADVALAAASRKVIADLNYAQNMAVSTQQTHFAIFTANQYDFYTRPAGSFVRVAHPVDKGNFTVRFGASATESALRRVTLDTVSVASTTGLAFDSLGTPMSYDDDTGVLAALSTTQTITLRSGGQTISVRIEPYTGEISVD